MRLYHGTGARSPDGEKLKAEDLAGGEGGLIHTHTDREAVANYAQRVWADEGYVIDCEADGELDDTPQVPDLDDWDPDALAKELVRAGTISQQEADAVTKGHDGTWKSFDRMQELLFELLTAREVRVIRYRNAFDIDLEGGTSAAITATGTLRTPTQVRE